MAKRKARLSETSEPQPQIEAAKEPQGETEPPTVGPSVSRTFEPLNDPFEFKTISAGRNKVHYGVSHNAKAYFLIFDENPNKDRNPADPHPVITKLKADGWNWRPTPNGVLAWKKPWAGSSYSFVEDLQQQNAWAIGRIAELEHRLEGILEMVTDMLERKEPAKAESDSKDGPKDFAKRETKRSNPARGK